MEYKLGKISTEEAKGINAEFVKNQRQEKFSSDSQYIYKNAMVLFSARIDKAKKNPEFFIGRISYIGTDMHGEQKIRAMTDQWSVRINNFFLIKGAAYIKPEKKKIDMKSLEPIKIKIGKRTYSVYEVQTKSGLEYIFVNKRFDLGDTIELTYKGKEYDCNITKIQVSTFKGIECWRYNYAAGFLKGWFLDITKNGKPHF